MGYSNGHWHNPCNTKGEMKKFVIITIACLLALTFVPRIAIAGGDCNSLKTISCDKIDTKWFNEGVKGGVFIFGSENPRLGLLNIRGFDCEEDGDGNNEVFKKITISKPNSDVSFCCKLKRKCIKIDYVGLRAVEKKVPCYSDGDQDYDEMNYGGSCKISEDGFVLIDINNDTATFDPDNVTLRYLIGAHDKTERIPLQEAKAAEEAFADVLQGISNISVAISDFFKGNYKEAELPVDEQREICESDDVGGEWNETDVTCDCGGGREWENNTCACPGNKEWNVNDEGVGVCECAGGKTWNAEENLCACPGNQVEKFGECACPGDEDDMYFDSSSSMCVCSGGKEWNEEILACECLGDQAWDDELSRCSCSSNEIWNEEAIRCMGKGDPGTGDPGDGDGGDGGDDDEKPESNFCNITYSSQIGSSSYAILLMFGALLIVLLRNKKRKLS